MASLIDQAKQIPASTIAEQQGIILKKCGSRYWACCPLHTEKHASMCFYPNGSWHCFSCKAGGDSVALLAILKHISMHDAAREICDQCHPSAAAPVIKNPHVWKNRRIKQLRNTIKQADEYTGHYSVEAADQAWDDPIFRAAILAKVQANSEIDDLYGADETELKHMMARGCRRSG